MKGANVKTILGDLYNELIAKEIYFNIIIYCKRKLSSLTQTLKICEFHNFAQKNISSLYIFDYYIKRLWNETYFLFYK